ncbi:DUF4352 domain-containing protein [Halorientalis salina]|uniref:DUF4352 domain-containing protein n=1 Tax=Halorientalis salina TaxID=2932266 RepID=UPI0010AC6BDF|nr:DUF4352 domain-containing protein [Halorientalis salina]
MTAETPFSRRRLLQSGAALGALALAGCSGGGSSTPTNPPIGTRGQRTNTPTATETEVGYTTADGPEPTARMGEVVADEKLALVVESTDKQTVGDEAFPSIELRIKNRTSGEYLTFDNMRMHLRDDEGDRYPRRVFGTDAGAEVRAEQLAPGELVWGRILFQAPADATGLSAVFTFDSPAISFDRVTVDLSETNDEGVTLEQSLDVVTYDVGETVTDGGLSVTVDGARVAESIGGSGAGEGRVFVVPKITVENGTDEPQTVRTIYHTSVKDGRGRAYGIQDDARDALSDGFPRSKQIAAGNSRTGEIPYAVPETAGSLHFVFDFSIDFDGFRRFWEL